MSNAIYIGPTESVTLPDHIKPEQVSETYATPFGTLVLLTDGRSWSAGTTPKPYALKKKYR